MTQTTPFIPFEADALRRAIGERAATAAPHVRVGALRLMAQMLKWERHQPTWIFRGRSTKEVDRVLDHVEDLIRKSRAADKRGGEEEEQAEPEPEPLQYPSLFFDT